MSKTRWGGLALLAATCGCGGGEGAIGAKAPEAASAAGAEAAQAEPTATPAEVCAKVGAAKVGRRFDIDGRGRHAWGRAEIGRDLAKPGATDKYTLAELKALEASQSWRELLVHAEDISPTARSAAWEAMIEKAAIEFLRQVKGTEEKYEAFHLAEGIVRSLPKLSASAGFMKERTEIAKPAFLECLSGTWSGEECLRTMSTFLKVGAPDPALAFDLGKMVRGKLNASTAVPFFKAGLAKETPAAKCADADLALAVVAGLSLPPDYDNAVAAREIASGGCFDTLKPALLEALKPDSGYYADNTCGVLDAKGALR